MIKNILMKNIIQKMLLFFFILMVIGYKSFAQDYECSSLVTKEIAKEVIENRKSRPNNGYLRTSDQVSIQAHIVTKSDGTEGLSSPVSTINDLKSKLDTHFSGTGITFNFNAIKYIKDDIYHSIDTSGTTEEIDMGLKFNETNKINIYFLRNVNTSWAKFPWDENNYDWIIMKNSHATSASTISHEMGHYFGLLHTHSNSNGDELVSRTAGNCSNCEIAGDGFCDTPADPNPSLLPINPDNDRRFTLSNYVDNSTNCEVSGIPIMDDCSVSYTPDGNNLMSYSLKACRDFFSQEQIDEILFYRQNGRDNLIPTTGEDPIYFECEANCNNELSLNCGALSAEAIDDVITISNLQINNQGSSNVSNVEIEYSLVGAENHILGTYTIPGPFAPGVTTPNGHILWINNIPDGSYLLQAKLKHGSGPYNSCTSLNQFTIGNSPTSGPDLEFLSCSTLSVDSYGYLITSQVGNTGEGIAPSCKIGVYLSSDHILDSSDSFIKESHVPSLPGGSSATAWSQFTLDGFTIPEGNVFIIFKVDNNSQVPETDEGNNICVYHLNSCGNNLYLSGNLGVDYNYTGTSITTTMTIIPPSTVNFKASSYVDWLPGFKANNGTTTTAYIEACGLPTTFVNANTEKSSASKSELVDSQGSGYVLNSQTDISKVFQFINSPNPFNKETIIELSLYATETVRIYVVDVNGKYLGDIKETGLMYPGNHQFTFDGTRYQAGIYYCTVIVGDEQKTSKMILIE